jgi:hypothetical protein
MRKRIRSAESSACERGLGMVMVMKQKTTTEGKKAAEEEEVRRT